MAVVISNQLVLSPAPIELDANNPIVGWENFVTVSNISSGNPDDGSAVENIAYPTQNLANVSTYQKFKQDVAGEDIYLRTTLNGAQEVDYLGIAGHNFGTGQRSLQVFGALDVDLSTNQPIFTELVQEIVVNDNSPLLFRFEPDNYIAIQIEARTFSGASDVAEAAVMFVGKLLVLERKIQVAFTPITYGRMPTVTSGLSESGNFLGRLVIGSKLQSSAILSHMTPAWYRANMDPFIEAAQTEPFFFAWAPETYPYEVGYAWMMEHPQPEIHDPTELWRITLQMQGHAA